ncbi:ABC transporter substrate-binding protein [Bradyrhizobium commune]|nr:ABC transporter substrate-binding protein [Bradyrhizobium commune]
MAVLLGSSAIAQDAYKIGALFPMSGQTASIGEQHLRATMLAIEQINADKVLKKPIELVLEDSQAQAQVAVIAMNKLVSITRVPVVLTSISGVTKAITPLGARGEVLVLNVAASSPDLAGLSPYLYSVIPLADGQVSTLLPYLAGKKNIKKIALVYVDDPLGQGIARVLSKDAPKNGQEIVASFALSSSTSQFASVATKLRESGAEAVFVAYQGGDLLVSLVKQLRDNGVNAPVVGVATLGYQSLIADPASEGMIYVSQKADWSAKDPLTRRFVEGFRQKFGVDPIPYDANFYNAIMILAKALSELERSGKEVTGRAIRDKFLEIRSFAIIGGELELRDDGTVTVPEQINIVEGKAVHVLQ